MKKLIDVVRSEERHWVGDGFPVQTLFSYSTPEIDVSPFLLLDHAGPARFEPSNTPRGVGEHPHRGFETVTIVYQGEVEHRDSAGNSGRIGPGDVQWMTAASGVVHEEMHGREFTRKGGTLEMVQLWVNLPARMKMSAPRYQTLSAGDFPKVELEGGGSVSVIAGSFRDAKGPAKTFTPIELWNLRLPPLRDRARVELPLADGHTAALLVLGGALQLDGGKTAGPGELALFARAGAGIAVEATQPTLALVMSGEPIDEPVVGYGPFVMNSQAEIRQAIADFRNGRLGHLAARE